MIDPISHWVEVGAENGAEKQLAANVVDQTSKVKKETKKEGGRGQ